jgi:F-type H+-transporting ATPase subunit gamma
MATIREVRKRIRSVENIQKITRTMEMVASARMLKATTTLFASRPYAQLAWNLISNLATKLESKLHPLLVARPVKNSLIVLLTSDRGLCGAFNLGLIHHALKLTLENKKFIAVGRKGRDFIIHRGYEVIAEFTGLSMPVQYLQVLPIGQVVIQDYLKSAVDEVYIVYSNFVSHLVQKPAVLKLLPIQKSTETPMLAQFTYEPSAELVLTNLIPRIIEYEIYAAILENQASEFAARTIAMKNASDNAENLISNLVLSYNKARQENITKELAELSTSRIVIEGN